MNFEIKGPAAVFCATCRTPLTAVEIAGVGYRCPLCAETVCVLCGCTDSHACAGGCAWLSPGVCSTHEAWLLAEVERVFRGGLLIGVAP